MPIFGGSLEEHRQGIIPIGIPIGHTGYNKRLLVVDRAQLLVWLLKVDDPCHGLWAERCVYQAEEK